MLGEKFLKDISSVFVSNITVLITSLLSGIITARFLGVEGKGLLAVLLVYPNLIVSFIQFGIRQATVYEIGANRYEYSDIVRNIILLFFILSIVGMIVCFFLLQSTINLDFSGVVLLFLVILTIPLKFFISLGGGIFLGKQRISLANHLSWTPSVLNLVFVVVFIVLLKLNIKGAFLATILSNFPAVILVIIELKKDTLVFPKLNYKIINYKIVRDILKLGGVFGLATFFTQLNYRIDVVLMHYYSTDHEIGLYSVGVNFAELILQVPAALGIVIFSQSSNSKNPKEFSNRTFELLKYSLGISLLIAVFLILFSSRMIGIMYGQEFADSAIMLQLLLPGIIGLVIYKIIGFDIAGKGKPWISVYATLPSLLLNIILNILIIPKYGGRGAAFSSSLSYICMAITHWYFFKKLLKTYK